MAKLTDLVWVAADAIIIRYDTASRALDRLDRIDLLDIELRERRRCINPKPSREKLLQRESAGNEPKA